MWRLQSFQVLHSQGAQGGLVSVCGPTSSLSMVSENIHDILIVRLLGLLVGCPPPCPPPWAAALLQGRGSAVHLSLSLAVSVSVRLVAPGWPVRLLG